VQQDDPDVAGVEVPEALRDGADEVVHLGHRLDPGEAPTGDDEGDEGPAHLRIALDVRLLEGVDEPVPQGQRVAEVLEGQGVLGEAGLTGEAGDGAEGDDEVVVLEVARRGAEPGGGDHAPARQVDPLDRAGVEVRARAQPPDRRDGVQEADAPRDHLGQHGLEDHVVVAVHERELDGPAPQLGRQPLLEGQGRVDPAEAAAEDQDPCGCSAHDPPQRSYGVRPAAARTSSRTFRSASVTEVR